MNISVVILTKNEEKNIEACIKSVSFADEIIVVDDYSTDKTSIIARTLGAKVFERKLESDFSAQRNFALKKASSEWVLFLDADEQVSKDLAREIVQLINDPTHKFEGFFLKRYDIIWGKRLKHGEIGGVRLLRLAKKSSGRWVRRVHEKWIIPGLTYDLKNPLTHRPHPGLSEFISDINWFSELHAEANSNEGKKSSIAKIIIWPGGKFVYNWIGRLGFLDGVGGFILAMLMTFNSFLAWSKLWLEQKKT